MNFKLFYPTSLKEIDTLKDNVDVCLKLDSGMEYTLVVTTPRGLTELMKKDKLPFIKPGLPFVVVEEITEENIRLFVEELLKEDEIFLRIYGGDVSDFYSEDVTLS